ncbi:MAG: leucine-rich repeat domain-containing protein, partial [Paramuribaculum sp.]|nr:leucine-rich repeat domain-containing protein [Paramuribaculum sp.]
MEKRKLIAALVILIFTNIFVGAQVRTEIIPIAQSEEWETVNWNFELNPQTYEATLVSPVDGAYKFINPGIDCIVASDGFTCSFWSPSVTGMAGESLYFTAIKIPETVMSPVDGKTYTVTAIGDRAFANSNIAYIHVPNTVQAIGEEAFAGCASLVGIDYVSAYELVPHSVTSLGKGAFKNCSSLKRIDIGDGVTEILPETFDGCISLQYIKIGASVIKISCILPPLEGIAFHSPAPPQIIHPLSVEEIWAPIANLDAYKVRFGDVKGFGIKPRQENTLKFYTGITRPVYIDIVSAPMLKADPTEK